MIFTDWLTILNETTSNIWDRFVLFLPNLIGAFLILIIGWIIGVIVSVLLDRFFRLIGLQTLFEKAKVEDMLKKANLDKDATVLLSSVARWIIYLIAFISAANILKLTAIASFLDRVLNFVPQALVAMGIMLIGIILANFLAAVIKGSVKASGLYSANTVSAVVRYSVLVFTILAALAELGIAGALINTLFIGLVAFLAIAGGLAFGLGGKDAAADWIEGIRKEIKE